jgi:hypothetical protein
MVEANLMARKKLEGNRQANAKRSLAMQCGCLA